MYEEEGSYTYFLRMGGKLVCPTLEDWEKLSHIYNRHNFP
jgi:hypothetical protein